MWFSKLSYLGQTAVPKLDSVRSRLDGFRAKLQTHAEPSLKVSTIHARGASSSASTLSRVLEDRFLEAWNQSKSGTSTPPSPVSSDDGAGTCCSSATSLSQCVSSSSNDKDRLAKKQSNEEAQSREEECVALKKQIMDLQLGLARTNKQLQESRKHLSEAQTETSVVRDRSSDLQKRLNDSKSEKMNLRSHRVSLGQRVKKQASIIKHIRAENIEISKQVQNLEIANQELGVKAEDLQQYIIDLVLRFGPIASNLTDKYNCMVGTLDSMVTCAIDIHDMWVDAIRALETGAALKHDAEDIEAVRGTAYYILGVNEKGEKVMEPKWWEVIDEIGDYLATHEYPAINFEEIKENFFKENVEVEESHVGDEESEADGEAPSQSDDDKVNSFEELDYDKTRTVDLTQVHILGLERHAEEINDNEQVDGTSALLDNAFEAEDDNAVTGVVGGNATPTTSCDADYVFYGVSYKVPMAHKVEEIEYKIVYDTAANGHEGAKKVITYPAEQPQEHNERMGDEEDGTADEPEDENRESLDHEDHTGDEATFEELEAVGEFDEALDKEDKLDEVIKIHQQEVEIIPENGKDDDGSTLERDEEDEAAASPSFSLSNDSHPETEKHGSDQTMDVDEIISNSQVDDKVNNEEAPPKSSNTETAEAGSLPLSLMCQRSSRELTAAETADRIAFLEEHADQGNTSAQLALVALGKRSFGAETPSTTDSLTPRSASFRVNSTSQSTPCRIASSPKNAPHSSVSSPPLHSPFASSNSAEEAAEIASNKPSSIKERTKSQLRNARRKMRKYSGRARAKLSMAKDEKRV